MKLQPINPPDTNGQRTPCYACGEIHLLADMFADLDGPAFRAYYCRPCVIKIAGPQHLPTIETSDL